MQGQIDMFEMLLGNTPKTEPKPQKKVVESAKPKADKPKQSGTIIKFPSKKPTLEKAATTGNASYDDCAKKMNAERVHFKGNDNDYVINGVLEYCEVDAVFRNNLMRDSRTYAGFMEYMSKCASDGYCYRNGNVGTMDNDMALGLAIDYYGAKEN